jgi:hypothetical protein
MMKTYQILARVIGARDRCQEDNPWKKRWADFLKELMEAFPSGSGFDRGTRLDDSSRPEKLVFTTAFHHMNEGGMYDGWTEHTVTVRPSLEFGYRLSISGRNRNLIKEVIAEQFSMALELEQEQFPQETAGAQ